MPSPPPDASPSPGPPPDPPPGPPSLGAWAPLALLYAALVGYLLVRNIGVPIYDDGYFFKRFALNALEHGVYAWNLEDGPVYGCTSQAFQVLATLVAALDPVHYVVGIKILCALSLAALGGALMRWSSRAADSSRGSMIALLALGSPLVLTTVLSGMETAPTLLVLGLVLMAMVKPDGRMPCPPGRAAALTVLVYLFRPDVALVPVVVTVVPALLRRELPVRTLGILAALMLVVLVALWSYYGTPLPLSFFMKTSGLQPYGPHVVALGLAQKQLHFGATLVFAAPLLWLALHRRDPANLALLAATAALWAYHLLMTTEIMGYRGRFYVPGLVPLCMAAARSDQAWARWGRPWVTRIALVVLAVVTAGAYATELIPTPADDYLGRIPWPCYAGLVLGAAWLLGPRPARSPRPARAPGRGPFHSGVGPAGMGVVITAAVLGWMPPAPFRLRTDAELLRLHARQVTTVRGLFDVARCLPEARNVYHSELGVTGLVLLRTRVVDLVGILSDHVMLGESFDTICERDRPEAIFLPHRNYRRLNAEIRDSSCFASYRQVVMVSSAPLHVRDDLVESFEQCATEAPRWNR